MLVKSKWEHQSHREEECSSMMKLTMFIIHTLIMELLNTKRR